MKKLIIAIVGVFILSSCVTEIEFETDNVSNFTVIGGVISNSPTEKLISVGRTTGIASQPEGISATGRVYKDGEVWRELDVLRTGVLALPAFLDLEVGSSYYVEISTEDGKTYRSAPQVVQPLLQTDSLSFDISTRIAGFNFKNEPIEKRFVDVYAHITIPNRSSGQVLPNYRWQVDESWSVKEQANAFENPDEITCYLTQDVSTFPSTVLSTEDLAGGTNTVVVAIRLLDTSFRQRHYFNVYLHSVDTRAIQYYQNSQRLINNNGTIYDEIPALVQGNIANIDDPQERVLGFVEFSLADTTRIAINYGDIGEDVFYFCVDAEDPCPYLPLPTGGTFRNNCECFECDSVFGQQARIKPFYWED